MKKVLAFLTALTALFCTACNEKNDNISENPPVGDVTSAVSETNISENKGENTETSEVSEENSVISQPVAGLKHYALDDFKEIKVNLNMQDSPPPVTFKEYDLSGIEFEAKKSPCKLPENVKIENIYPESHLFAELLLLDHEEYKQKFISEDYALVLEAEEMPLIPFSAFDGENIYYLGDYDTVCCNVSHNFEIFKYNPETGENISIYEYSDGTEGVAIADMIYYDDSIWVLTLISDALTTTDRVSFITDMKSQEIKTYRLDETSGELKEDLLEKEFKINSISLDGYSITCKRNVDLEYPEEKGIKFVRENNQLTAETADFTLETGILDCYPVLFTDKRLCLLKSDVYSATLYTFDFEKMELYTTELQVYDFENKNECPIVHADNCVEAFAVGEHILVHYTHSHQYMYFIPELGAGFGIKNTELASKDIRQFISPHNTTYRTDHSQHSIYNNSYAILNYDSLVHNFYLSSNKHHFSYNNHYNLDVYTPSITNPLKKLYIFETD
ncbi:MAG: hypothetical protein IJB68_01740 [Ruminococcus sp.]|nr:hypothetical protein [Ruminococcus sp.]